jgi:D-3-phosphoglycerate dehydrogenase / 2-oxoglutarate reductase
MTGSISNHELCILNTECGRFSDAAIKEIEKLGDVTHVEADRSYLLENVVNYEIMLIALHNTIDREILERATNLKYIVTPTTGHNHIDCDFAKEKGIQIISLRGETEFLETIRATADLAWGLLLSLIRHIPSAHQDVLNAQWDRNKYYGNELKAKVLGVIGYGRLGKMVAQYGRAFGMFILAYDQHKFSNKENTEFVGLDELLSRSDVISLHLPLNKHTNQMLDQNLFQKMKEGMVFINTARGEIVDEGALIEALKSGKVASAATDVLADEVSLDQDWLKNNKLVNYARSNKNLIITPHIGGVTYESVEQANIFIIHKLGHYIRNEKIL